MEALIAGLHQFLNASAIIASVILGVIIGAFYKWEHRNGTIVTLFVVGIGFAVLLAVYSALALTSDRPVGTAIGRGFLWGITCTFMWVGQTIRLLIEQRRIDRRRRRHNGIGKGRG